VKPGSRLGPYEVIAPLGAGGMGVVYRGRDSRLGRDVAIKVLPSELAADPDRLRRFEQEARAASALDHPNILTVHDVGSFEGQPYLVTELLEGETLRGRLEGGALPVRKAVEIAVQVAQGLAAAHAKGIVHRDVKPENLFLTADGRVKILDFGLAKLLEAPLAPADLAHSPTRVGSTETGAMLGSAGYMAPEQIRLQPVDARTDIFALGCVLHEMLSGSRAFPGESIGDVIAAILTKDPGPLPATVPAALATVVHRCLEKRPDDRFSSAHDLAFALVAAGGDRDAGPAAVLDPPSTRTRHRFAVRTLVALGLVAAGVAGWLVTVTPRPTGLRLDSKKVVVAIFENHTGDRSLDALGKLACESIAEGLSRTGAVDVVPCSVVFSLAAENASGTATGVSDPARRLAEATGAGLVVSGASYAQGTEIRVHSTITDASTGRSTSPAPAVAARSAPEKAIDAVRQRVMGAIAVRLDTTFQSGAAGAAPDYQAYQEFLAGYDLIYEDDAAAIAHFNRAVELDPMFITPHFALLGRTLGGANRAEGLRHLAVLEAKREQLNPAQRQWLAAFRARFAGRHEEALAAAREAVRLNPDDVPSVNSLAIFASYANHLRESIEILSSQRLRTAFGSSAARGPRRWMYYYNLCLNLHLLGKDEWALAEARRGREFDPDVTALVGIQVWPLAGLGRFEEIDRTVDEGLLMASRFPVAANGRLMWLAAHALRWHGHREAATGMANRAIDWLRAHPAGEGEQEQSRIHLAGSLCVAERWDEAKPVLEELVRDFEGNEAYLGLFGVVAARRGDRAEALRISESLRRIESPSWPGGSSFQRAAIAAHLGEKERAVGLLREALAAGILVQYVHGDLGVEPLRGHPPFEELMKPKE
jgi:tetratricopeptide (TPR) repeat protein